MHLRPETARIVAQLAELRVAESDGLSKDAAEFRDVLPEYFGPHAERALAALIENLSPEVQHELVALDQLSKKALKTKLDGQASQMFLDLLHMAKKSEQAAEQIARKLALSPLHLHIPKAMESLGYCG